MAETTTNNQENTQEEALTLDQLLGESSSNENGNIDLVEEVTSLPSGQAKSGK